jgi:uncharacterized protein YerC
MVDTCPHSRPCGPLPTCIFEEAGHTAATIAAALEVHELYEAGHTEREIAEATGRSIRTVFRLRKIGRTAGVRA